MLSFIPCSRTSEGLRIWIGDWVIECVLVAGQEKIIAIDLARPEPWRKGSFLVVGIPAHIGCAPTLTEIIAQAKTFTSAFNFCPVGRAAQAAVCKTAKAGAIPARDSISRA